MTDVKPHNYRPSVEHMGDCSVCGHVAESPLHLTAEELARRALNTARRKLGPAKAEDEAREHIAGLIESALSAARNAALEEAIAEIERELEGGLDDATEVQLVWLRGNIRALKDKE